MSARETLLLNMFQAMLARNGPSRWWPAKTAFEVVVGVILTQNTNWKNVERALDNLRQAELLQPEKLYALPEEQLAELIRPAGYYRLKAKRLRNMLSFLREECGFDLDSLGMIEHERLRWKLLGIRGVGQESADSVLLYALGKPSFVVDAYTRRMLHRHGLIPEDADYEEIRAFYMEVLPEDVALYNEYHAQIVRTVKEWCLKRAPRCEDCPLRPFLDSTVVVD